MTSQRLSAQRFAPSANIHPLFQRESCAPRGKELAESWGDGTCVHQKPTNDFPNTSQYNVLLYPPPFGQNSQVKLSPPPVSGKSGTTESKMVKIVMSMPHSYSTSIHTIILHCLATINNAADRDDR